MPRPHPPAWSDPRKKLFLAQFDGVQWPSSESPSPRHHPVELWRGRFRNSVFRFVGLSFAPIGVAHDQLPITIGLASQDLDRLVPHRNSVSRVIDARALKVGAVTERCHQRRPPSRLGCEIAFSLRSCLPTLCGSRHGRSAFHRTGSRSAPPVRREP